MPKFIKLGVIWQILFQYMSCFEGIWNESFQLCKYLEAKNTNNNTNNNIRIEHKE